MIVEDMSVNGRGGGRGQPPEQLSRVFFKDKKKQNVQERKNSTWKDFKQF